MFFGGLNLLSNFVCFLDCAQTGEKQGSAEFSILF